MAQPPKPLDSESIHQARLQELRRRHPRFAYESFSIEQASSALRVRFRFRIEPDIAFSPETVIEVPDPEWLGRAAQPAFENLVFHLGLVEMLSCWKAACSPEIVIQAGSLNAEQIAWWLDLLRRGMGEYFYVNQIDFRPADFVRIIPEGAIRAARVSKRGNISDTPLPHGRGSDAQQRDLVLTSGGKDSVVTLELLREAGLPFDCLLLNPTPAALAIAKQAGCEKPIIVHRTIDKRLLELNAQGYLNGHTPFSALLAFLGVAVAALGGYSRVIVSNERSAEEAGVEYLGHPINHQYSKTLQFETAFREYARKHLSTDIEYFSLLRPLYELQIARLFARYPQYFPLFRSCNRGMATNTWCGRCPKCLFVFTVLYPFVKREQVLSIFGADLFAWEGAAEVLRALLGQDAAKPLECVGTREETLAAVHLCVEKYREEQVPLPASLQTMQETVLSARTDLPELTQRVLADQHFLPPELQDTIRGHVS